MAGRIAAEVTGIPTSAEFGGEGFCMLEAGHGVAGFAAGDFFAEPAPHLEVHQPHRAWHWGKVLFEQWWLAPAGPRRAALQLALKLGARRFGIPVPA